MAKRQTASGLKAELEAMKAKNATLTNELAALRGDGTGALIRIPLGEIPPDVYPGRHVDVQLLQHTQRQALQAVFLGLD